MYIALTESENKTIIVLKLSAIKSFWPYDPTNLESNAVIQLIGRRFEVEESFDYIYQLLLNKDLIINDYRSGFTEQVFS